MLQAIGVIGALLTAYGGIREALAALARSRPYGEGRFGEGVFGGAVDPRTNRSCRPRWPCGCCPRTGS